MDTVPPALARRVLELVNRRGPDECWPWGGSTTKSGHGRIRFGPRGDSRLYFPHRVVWVLYHGPIPPGLCVLHHCDNPPCCNWTRCLFLGTRADNILDMIAKGRDRKARGQQHFRTTVTDEQVREMRRLHRAGMFQRELAERFSVSQPTVSAICRRHTWAHLSD